MPNCDRIASSETGGTDAVVRRPGDDSKFAGGRAAERLKLFELQRGPAQPSDRSDDTPAPQRPAKDSRDEK
jgi:hypothetical protein